MSISTRRSRNVRKRHELTQDSDNHPIQRWVASDPASKRVSKNQAPPDNPTAEQSTVEEPDAPQPQKRTLPGRTLDWPGFSMTMETAVAKELLTDWRFEA